jgi:hypothetical protein
LNSGNFKNWVNGFKSLSVSLTDKRTYRKYTIQTFYDVLLAVLVAQIAFGPSLSYAPDPNGENPAPVTAVGSTQEEQSNVSPAVAEFAAAAAAAKKNNAPFYLENWRRNTGFILGHTLTEKPGAEPLDISQLQLDRSASAHQHGVVQYALEVKADGHKLSFSLKGDERVHTIDLTNLGGENFKVRDFDWDNEFVHILLENGDYYTAEVDALRTSLFQTWFPLYYMGNADKAVGQRIDHVRILQRRVDPADRSAAAQMARLDFNEKTAESIRKNASADLVVRLKENLEMVKPFKVAPALEAVSEKTESGEPLFDAGNLGFFLNNGDGTETLAEIETVEKITAKVGTQEPFIDAMVTMANPDTAESLRDTQGVSQTALEEMTAILGDPQRLQEFESSGLRGVLSNIDKRTLQATRAHTVRLAKAMLDAYKNGTRDALRDRFTPSQLEEANNYFSALVTEAESIVATRGEPKRGLTRTMDAIQTWSEKRFGRYDPIKRMRAVGTALKKPLFYSGLAVASAASLDYLVTNGNNVTWATETMMGMWNLATTEWIPNITSSIGTALAPVGNALAPVGDALAPIGQWASDTAAPYIPIIKSPSAIAKTVIFSWPAQLALLMSPLILAKLGSRWSQYSANELLVIKGIKWCFSWATLPPMRAALNAPQAAVDATRYTLSAPFMATLGAFNVARWGYRYVTNQVRSDLGFSTVPYQSIPLRYALLPSPVSFASTEAHNALRRGYIPFSLARPFFTQAGQTAAVERLNAKIDNKEAKKFAAKALAVRLAADKHRLNPFDLLAKIANSGNSKLTRRELSLITIAMTDQISSDDKGTAISGDAQASEFIESLAHFTALADKEVSLAIRPAPGAAAQLRFVTLPRLISASANFGEAAYEEVADPKPAEAACRYVVNGYLMDSFFGVGQTTFVGAWANPNDPDALAYQPDGFLNTHSGVWINLNEQVALHLGLVAALTVTTWSKEDDKVFQRYAPASTMDVNRNKGAETVGQSLASLVRNGFDWRNSNPAEIFGKRSWRQCVQLFQGFFLIGTGIRLLEGLLEGTLSVAPGGVSDLAKALYGGSLENMQSSLAAMADPATLTAWGTAWKDAMLKAIDGQIYFLFLAPFAYRYWWAEDQAIVEGMEREVAQLGGEFQTQFSVFSQALGRKDLDAAEEAGNKLLDMYQAEHRSIPDDVLLAVRRKQGEDRETWMQRLMQTAVKESAVAEQINPKVNKGRFLAVSFITTLLAGYLMQGSLNGRQILGDGSAPFGIDLTHWNLFFGTTPGDGAHAIILKSLVMINAIWLAGLTYKAAWDGGKIAVSKVAKLFTGSSNIPPDTEFSIDPVAQQEQEIATELAAAVTAPVPAVPTAGASVEADRALWERFQGSIKSIGAFFGIGRSQEARALQEAQIRRAVSEACSELIAAEAKVKPRTTASAVQSELVGASNN